MNRKVTAALLSGLVCPGAGQLYNRERIKGAVLVLAVLFLISLLVYKTWDIMLDMVLAMPPEEAFKDLFGLARRVVEANKKFYDWTVSALVVIWAYGIVDAYIKAGRSKG